MCQKKCWDQKEDNIIRNYVYQATEKVQWKKIAQKVNLLPINQNSLSKRTSKQCRQRWHNKLNPQIIDKQWDQEQTNTLLNLHNEYGNKWSLIAEKMPGRTDNCIKNKFYSSLRKGMRKINKYIVNLKRKLAQNKNSCIKQFKDAVLTKVIAVADKKYNDKLDVKQGLKSKIQNISECNLFLNKAIKVALVRVSKNEDDYNGHVMNGVADKEYLLEETLLKNIQEFCRNCKKKKTKRRDDDDDNSQLQLSASFIDHQISAPKFLKNPRSQKFLDKLPSENQDYQTHKRKTQKTEKILFQDSKLNQFNNTSEDFNENQPFNHKFSLFADNLSNFLRVATQMQKQQEISSKQSKVLKLSTGENVSSFFNCQSHESNASSPKFSFLQNIRVEFERTDHNQVNKVRGFHPHEIFKQCSSLNPFQDNSHHMLSSSIQNPFSLIEKSQSFLNLYRSGSVDFTNELNAVMDKSSSMSSSSNKLQQKLMQQIQLLERSDHKLLNPNEQLIGQSFNLSQSLQFSELFKKVSQNQN